MEACTIQRAQQLSSPNPFALVCSGAPDGTTNLVAVSWWTYLSNRPPMLGFALNAAKHTSRLLADNPSFALCLPGEALKDRAFACGTASGATIDKALEFGIPMTALKDIAVQVPDGCRLVIAGRVVERHPVGDHLFHVAEITVAYENSALSQLYAADGYRRLTAVETK